MTIMLICFFVLFWVLIIGLKVMTTVLTRKMKGTKPDNNDEDKES